MVELLHKRSIYKYVVPRGAHIAGITMPEGAKLLTAQKQYDDIVLWAVADPKAPMVTRRIGVAVTGDGFAWDGFPYIATVALHGGSFIVHLFDLGGV